MHFVITKSGSLKTNIFKKYKQFELVRGFTLIELLVVIAIIGILSAVVLALLSGARKQGSDSSAKASINAMRGAAENYYSDPPPGGVNSYGSFTSFLPFTYTPTTSLSPLGSGISVCLSAEMRKLGVAAAKQLASQSVICGRYRDSYTVYAALNAGGALPNFCIDSTGFSGVIAVSGPADPGRRCK